jgi:hypothetical protein
MKRTRLKKVSTQTASKLDRKLKELCKQIVRLKYGNSCYTCGQSNLTGSNWQTGHVPWPKASLGAYLRWDLRCLRPQCWRCNINLGGMGAVAYQKMLKEEGKAFMTQLERDRQVTVKTVDHYQSLIPKYQSYLEELGKLTPSERIEAHRPI